MFEYWFGKVATGQNLDQIGFDALHHAEDGIWRAFATNQAESQKQCKAIGRNIPYNIFDLVASQAFKQGQNAIINAL